MDAIKDKNEGRRKKVGDSGECVEKEKAPVKK